MISASASLARWCPMDDFVAYPSRSRIIPIVLSCLAFVAGGLWMAGTWGEQPTSSIYSPTVMLVGGWAAAIFFGLCSVLWTTRLLGRREHLRISSDGIRSSQWSKQTIPWSEIVEVSTWHCFAFARQAPLPCEGLGRSRRGCKPWPYRRRHRNLVDRD